MAETNTPLPLEAAVAPTAAADTTTEAAEKARRPRGKGIIYFGLREADEAIRKIDQHAKRMSKTGFARALGHESAQNRFMQKVDTLKQFSLVLEEDDDVVLTPLAVDMLYAGSEQSRSKARVQAFFAYEDFKRTFVECPKNQEHALSYVREFAGAKLGIVNEVEKFLKLFLESASFAGLLEGEPNVKAEKIRLRAASYQETPINGTATQKTESAGYLPLGLEEEEPVLASLGLSGYRGRVELQQMATGRVKIQTGTDRIIIEVDRPLRVSLKTQDVLTELLTIVNHLKEKGYQA